MPIYKVIDIILSNRLCTLACEDNDNVRFFIVPVRFVEENRVTIGGYYGESEDGESEYRVAL